jgi:hypothetical protein
MRYLITGTKSAMQLTVGYDGRGLLCEVQVADATDEKAIEWTVRNVPIHEDQVREVFKAAHLKLTVLQVTFDEFWRKYNIKEDKLDAQRAWAALNDADRQLAFNYIDRYKADCINNRKHLQYPATYLRHKRWLDKL